MKWSVLLMTALLALSGPALSQPSPDKAIRLATGFPPGGPTDLMARAIGAKLQALWKNNVIVETRPGASGALAMQQLKAAPPDGQFLLIAPSNTLAVTPYMVPQIGYDPLVDFTPLWLVATIDNVLLVNASLPAKDLQELVALARTRPGGVTFGSPANGSQAHLSGEFMNGHFGIRMLHVPYKGTAPALNDLLGGHIQMMFTPVAQALPHVNAGKVRAMALPARQRNSSMPSVPTFSELGIKDFEAATWFMLIGPAGMPPKLVTAYQDAMAEIARDPELRERITKLGADLSARSPAELPAFLKSEAARWSKVVRDAGIKAD